MELAKTRHCDQENGNDIFMQTENVRTAAGCYNNVVIFLEGECKGKSIAMILGAVSVDIPVNR
jgi:hypothetical protein